MNNSKHPKVQDEENPFKSDLERDPGIGRSKGTTMSGEDPKTIAGENTVEGDVGNDATATGRVPDYDGRTNE